ncbi:MAG: hypothetical protein HY248_01245, partial [Fimbriimonas ginsengisoli]|nr:hypothetical protein [Fimbriimonas ginsengisoli]
MPENEPSPSPAPPSIAAVEAQIRVLKENVTSAAGTMAREALQEKIADLEKHLALLQAKRKQEEEAEPPPSPSTAEQLLEADGLLRQARVAKMRGQNEQAAALLQQAADTAPGAAAVLEAVGDEFAERRRWGEARSAYLRAHRADPLNPAIERKYAQTILRTTAGFTVEQALGGGLDSPFVDPSDAAANAKWAAVLSFFVPGAGHFALGETVTGFWL